MLKKSIEPAELRSAAVPWREEAAVLGLGGGERGRSLEEGHFVEAPIASHEMEIHRGIHCIASKILNWMHEKRSKLEGLESTHADHENSVLWKPEEIAPLGRPS